MTHQRMAVALSATAVAPPGDAAPSASLSPPSPAAFDVLYEAHADFIFRSLRRLGVASASVDDALQDVFLVAHRRLAEFEGRSTHKTWLFGIAFHVAQRYRRGDRRRASDASTAETIDPDTLSSGRDEAPLDSAAHAERVLLLYALLDTLDDAKRAVFVLAELEEMTVPAISEALGVKENTVYSRLRLARADFEQALQRHRARGRAGGKP